MPELPIATVDDQQLQERVRSYQEYPELAGRSLDKLAAEDPSAFRAAAVRALRPPCSSECRAYVIKLLSKAGMLPLCDPALLSLEEEVAIVSEAVAIDPTLDLKLARRFGSGAAPMPDEVALRVIDLLLVIANNNRVLPLIVKLLHDPNPKLRAKAVRLLARSNMAPKIAERLMTERDARVRANAVEALWGSDTPAARALFREATRDGNNRVAGNALLGLYLLGEVGSIPMILKMAAHPDPLFRATAAWVMERTGNPRFLPLLKQLVRDSGPGTRNRVFRAITSLKQAAARFQESPRLRVHLLAASTQPDGRRLLRAAIATETGQAVQNLPATGVVVWENARPIEQFNVRSLPVPERLSVGLFFPEGGFGDRAIEALGALRRERDRWAVVRYGAASPLALLQQTFGSLGPIGLARNVFVHAGLLWDPADETGRAQLLRQAQGAGVTVHSVALAGQPAPHGAQLASMTGGVGMLVDSEDQAVAAYERLLLSLLRSYEIEYLAPTGTVLPAEIKLEVYAPSAYGVDVLRAASPVLPAADSATA